VRAASIVGGGLLLLPIEMVPWATYANLVGGVLAAMVVVVGLASRRRDAAIASRA
jgi:hypothetical protein